MNKYIFFDNNPYSLDHHEKTKFFLRSVNYLNLKHYNGCFEYKKIINFFNYKKKINLSLNKLPYLPIQMFKKFDLLSVNKKKIIKIMYSSGTSGQRSKINLDKQNSLNQIKALKNIFQFNFGKERLPMIILSKKNLVNRNNFFDAKNAAFMGFSMFGRDYFFLINDEGEINYEGLNKFLKKHKYNRILMFGFTADVYDYLINKINIKKIKCNLAKVIILHGGGWKKLENKRISKKIFKRKLKSKLLISEVYNYYGLIEQTGSIFLECKCGYFVTTNFSDVIIRDKNLNEIKKYNERGLIQLISILPTSYPGHNILTEDIGEIVSNKKCKCKIHGKRFLVHGRAEKAEVRGCSDAI